MVRLWKDIPPDERITEDFIVECETFAPYRETVLQRLRQPQCHAAVQSSRYRGFWSPCGTPVAKGEIFCKMHGGATSSRQRMLDELEMLADTWRREADDLYSQELPSDRDDKMWIRAAGLRRCAELVDEIRIPPTRRARTTIRPISDV
jgi:hypothetical protein